MTVKEAILHLNYLKDFKTPDQVEALDMAIKALEEPSYNSVKSELDAISRQAVQDYIAKYLSQYLYNDVREAVEVIDEYIGELPPVKPQEKTGHWTHDGSHWKNRFICSECGYKLFDEPTNYCPNCGAKMVEPKESETWNGIHAQITAPKGTFERIFNEADDDNNI